MLRGTRRGACRGADPRTRRHDRPHYDAGYDGSWPTADSHGEDRRRDRQRSAPSRTGDCGKTRNPTRLVPRMAGEAARHRLTASSVPLKRERESIVTALEAAAASRPCAQGCGPGRRAPAPRPPRSPPSGLRCRLPPACPPPPRCPASRGSASPPLACTKRQRAGAAAVRVLPPLRFCPGRAGRVAAFAATSPPPGTGWWASASGRSARGSRTAPAAARPRRRPAGPRGGGADARPRGAVARRARGSGGGGAGARSRRGDEDGERGRGASRWRGVGLRAAPGDSIEAGGVLVALTAEEGA